ncbi:hypothetical protein VE02_09586 [Pseudogymnoascus sp. 03VT05]|nr:hypothetical protein VE02_09586 [Pseudogymnoascus sp. 03VT05]
MPAATHERFITSVILEIARQLQIIGSLDSLASDFARQIVACGSTTIYLHDGYGRHDPDFSFRHKEAQYPGVVFEVSYSQKRRDLGRLADDYILGSDGNIRVVVGLDLEYRGKKGKEASGEGATLSIWRPKVTSDGALGELTAHQDVVDLVRCYQANTRFLLISKEFRDKYSIAHSSYSAGISLRLDDFATTALHPSPMSEPIFIPTKTLTEYLFDAEKAEVMLKGNTGARQVLGDLVRRRKRLSTPVEELDKMTEKWFREEEERANRRAWRADKGWRPARKRRQSTPPKG